MTTTNLPALPDGFSTGLEEFDSSDAVIPRLTIAHESGTFKDNLSGETFEAVNLVILGLVKQRVLWHPTVDEGDSPMCKSPNNKVGFPNLEAPKDKRFPWTASGFNPSDFTPGPDGLVELPCDACSLKEWGTHPNGKSPWCTEQWTLPVQYEGYNQGEEPLGVYSPAIFTLQRSGMKAIRAYLTSYQRSGNPAFVNLARCTLEVNRRGTVTYSVPKFSRIGNTDQTEWPGYARQFMQIRDYLQRRPVTDEETVVESSNTNTAPQESRPQQQTKAPEQRYQSNPTDETDQKPRATAERSAPASSPAEDEDDLPF